MPHSLTDRAGLNASGEDFLAAVLETAAQPIWAVDPDDMIRFANPAAVTTLGYDGADQSPADGGTLVAADIPLPG